MKYLQITWLFLCFSFLAGSTIAQTPNNELSQSELEQFVLVQRDMDKANEVIQEKMIGTIEENDFTLERFNEIYESKTNPEVILEITEKESASFDTVMSEIQEIQIKFQEEALEVLRNHSMSQEDYQRIYINIQSSPENQQRYLKAIER